MKGWMIVATVGVAMLGALLGTGCAKGGDSAGMPGWKTSLDEGLAEAKASGKLVMVDFAAVW